MPDTMTPDLSHLGADVRLRIEVAETQGATWAFDSVYSCWGLAEGPVGGPRIYAVPWNGRGHEFALPNPLTDPAEWGALMEKERITLCAPDCEADAGADWAAFPGDPLLLGMYNGVGWGYGPPGRAICLAVLAKYGRDTSPYTDYGAPSSPVAQGEAQ